MALFPLPPPILRCLLLSFLRQFVGHSLLPPSPVVQGATGLGIASLTSQCATNAVKQDTFAVPVTRRATPATSTETTHISQDTHCLSMQESDNHNNHAYDVFQLTGRCADPLRLEVTVDGVDLPM